MVHMSSGGARAGMANTCVPRGTSKRADAMVQAHTLQSAPIRMMSQSGAVLARCPDPVPGIPFISGASVSHRTHRHRHTHTDTLARAHTHTRTGTHVSTHIRTHARTQVHKYTYVHTYVHTHASVRTRTRTHTHTRTYTQTHRHVRTHSHRLLVYH